MNLAAAVRVLALAAVAAATSACQSAASWMQNGMPAPELSGRTVTGEEVSLAAHRGKVATVIFFADWCPHCRALYATERELAKRAEGGQFVLIGVDADDTEDALRAALRRERISWPVIHDVSRANVGAWGVDSLPTIFVVDRAGVIRAFGLKGAELIAFVDGLIAQR